jgi:5-hydroxyisourate hydrolase-like protein (transthyretin family)
MISAYAVALMLSAVLSCVAQSPARPAPATGTINATIDDTDSGQPLSNAHVEVQLFPPEHGARKFLSLLCVPSEGAQPLFTFALTTDLNGSFSLTAPGGDYLAKATILQREPVFGCIFFDTEESVRRCGSDPLSVRIHQHVFVRTTRSIPGFSGDMLSSSACAPYQPSPCEPLRVPNRVQTNKFVLRDFEGSPIGNARLEFHEYTKGKGKFVGRLMTDASGVADVSSLKGGLRMSIESERASGEFIIDFTRAGAPGQQTIKMFHWRCRGNVMQGAMVQP